MFGMWGSIIGVVACAATCDLCTKFLNMSVVPYVLFVTCDIISLLNDSFMLLVFAGC